MSEGTRFPPPPVIWAQSKQVVFVTICLEDCEVVDMQVESQLIYFKGIGGTEKKMHEVTINLYKEIDRTKIIKHLSGRTLELVLSKKEVGPYWPRLTKEETKVHWLKSDFNKWEDESDSEEETHLDESTNLEEMMRKMGGLGGSRDKKLDFDDLDDMGDEAEETDSENDDLPDLVF